MMNKSLTIRELEMVQHVAYGCSNRDIAARLECSPQTVKNVLNLAYYKLRVNNRTQAAAWAWIHGLVDPAQARRVLAELRRVDEPQ